MKVKIQNPVDTCEEKTALSADVDSASSDLTVLNNDGISANDYVVIGRMGGEQAELIKVSSVSGATSITLNSNTSFNHGSGEPIFVIPYNQIEVSRKTGKNGTFAVLDTINIEPDELETVYEDTGGQTTHFYRVRLKNAQTGQFSSYSGTLQGTGYGTRAAKTMVDAVLHRVNDEDADFTTRKQVLRDLDYAHQTIINKLLQASHEYFLTRIEIPTENYKHEYTLPDDFREIQVIRDGGGTIIPAIPRSDQYWTRGYELTGVKTLYLEDVPKPSDGSTDAPVTIITNNGISDEGTWTASLDATNLTTDLNEYKIGDASLNFDLDVSSDAGNEAVLTNSTVDSEDLSSYEDTGKLRFWFHIPDVTYTSSVTLRWGSSSSDYWGLEVTKDYKDHAFSDGWNLLEFDWASDDVTETGSPDSSAVDYLQVRLAYTANQADDEDYRLDAIMIADTWDANSVYEVTYLKQPSQLKNEMDEIGIPPGYEYLLVDYAVAHIMLRQGERDTTALRLLRGFDDEVKDFLYQSSKRTRRMRGFRPFGRVRRYTLRGGRSTRVVRHSDGNITKLK